MLRTQPAAWACLQPTSLRDPGSGAGKPARGLDVVEDKTELASLLEAEKSRRRLLEQRFSTAQEEADKLRYFICIQSTRRSWLTHGQRNQSFVH